MCSSVLFYVTSWILCHALTVNKQHVDIIAKSKIELMPIQISCKLYNMVLITAPSMDCESPLYHLHKPNGNFIELDLPRPKKINQSIGWNWNYFHNEIYENDNLNEFEMPYPNNFRIIDLNEYIIVDLNEVLMGQTDFLMGPFSEQDDGNWVLSVYCKDIDGNWVETFKTITISIVETVPIVSSKPDPKIGDTVELSFAYPISHLESCELVAPRETFDRYYDRNRNKMDRCGYLLPNVTKQDEGSWKIIGVGQIVYEGTIELNISSKWQWT